MFINSEDESKTNISVIIHTVHAVQTENKEEGRSGTGRKNKEVLK